jgi:3-methylcrotonyl-CoA carboxylase alpha subunit
VEFLFDTQQADKFYFCEMNTRLQVEHPITECITGIDLVEWQLRIAAGEELPIKEQSDIPCRGHALEARIYAENPARNFLPATGTVWHHSPPTSSNTGMNSGGVRVDTGIQNGQDVGVYYDPMICKLIVHDVDRQKALDKLVNSLKQYQIAGVPTNIEFLIKCAQHDTFKTAGAVNTGFLDDHLADVQVTEEEATPPLAAAVGAFVSLLHLEGRFGVEDLEGSRRAHSPWTSLSGSWRMGGPATHDLELEDGTGIHCTCRRDGSYDIRIGSSDEYHIDGTILSSGDMEVVVNKTKRLAIKSSFHDDNGKFEIRMWPQHIDDYFWKVDIQNPMNPASIGTQSEIMGEGTVKAPMPGKISRINANVGDHVQEGDVLVVMEAMKMEHAIEAPVSGTLTEMHFEVGDIVQDGITLAVVEHACEEDGHPSEAV